MPMAAGRRVGVGIVLGLLGAALVVTVVPGDPGAIRLAGVATRWWFALAAALVSTVTTCICLRPPTHVPVPRSDTIAAWAAPVVLVSLASRVFAGTADAPVLALALLAAPLVALYGPGTDGPHGAPVAGLASAAAVGLALWANLHVVADVASVVGVPRHPALAIATALAFVPAAWRVGAVALRWSLILGLAGLVLPIAMIGAVVAGPPWVAWSRTASRPALTFVETSAWVTHGRRVAAPATLAFTEAHRVTALSPAPYRVVEEDARGSVSREWRLSPGDALTLRPGDRLILPAGAQVRFEAGKRVPGTPVSGAAWADPPERRSVRSVAHTLGAAVTLVGGALALSPPPGRLAGRGALVGPALLLTLTLSAVCWGVYGVDAAPELALGRPPAAGLVELPALALAPPAGRALAATCVVALLLLFVATAQALRGVMATVARGRKADVAWALLLFVAAVAALAPGDAWRGWLTGCGLAAAAVVAPRLAAGGRRAVTAGSLAGAAAFAVLAVFGSHLPAWAAPAGAYPVLLAGPLAWATGRAWRVAGAARG